MKIQQHYEDSENDLIRFEVTLESKTLELHSSLTEIDLDTKADIKKILDYASRTISQMLRPYVKRK